MKKITVLFSIFLTGLTCSALAVDQGSCDPQKSVCITSVSTDKQGTLHYVDRISVKTVEINYLYGQPQIVVENNSGRVFLVDGTDKTILLGTVSEPVGENTFTALTRSVDLAAGVDLSISSQPGKDISSCNGTALGFIYEHNKYHSTDFTLTVSQDSQPVGIIRVNQEDEMPYRSISSPFPCPK